MNRMIGCILLIIGTTIGGGMLALPVATAIAGFWKSSLLIIFSWLVMTLGSLLVLEVNLWLPKGSNFSSMAKKTLGRPGQILAWLSYGLILYSVLCAYTTGGSNLLQSMLLSYLHLHTPIFLDQLIYIFFFGAIIWKGTHVVDHANRLLMIVKLSSLLTLFLLLAPHTNPHKLYNGSSKYLMGAAAVVALSFTFSVIIPSMRIYLNDNVKRLKIAIWIGSTIPLLVYLLWDYVVQSTVPTHGSNSLTYMAHSGKVVAVLTTALSNIAHSEWLALAAHVFASVCMLTTFLAVSLSLSDFLADAMNRQKKGSSKWLIYGATFVPVLLILSINPNIFIKALSLAGVLCILIVLIMPPLMAWRGRYHQKTASGFQVPGGKPLLATLIIVGCLLIFTTFIH